jgi:hypothetical protein
MNKLMPFYLLAFIVSFFFNCKKDNSPKADNPYGLPNISQSGVGVLAWRENGQNRIAQNNISGQNAYILADSVAAFGMVTSTYYESVLLQVYGNAKINIEYDFTDKVHTKFLYSTDSTCYGGVSSNVLNVSDAIGGVIFSKIDGVNRILSGTFQFKVPVSGCDTIYFTDGRFDIRY